MTTRTVSELAALCGAALEGDGDRRIAGPASLSDAAPDEVSFLGSPLYLPELESTRAGAVVVAPDVHTGRGDLALLRCEDPGHAFTLIVEEFLPPPERPAPGVHPTAVVSPEAELGAEVSVGPHCVVGAAAILGDGAWLYPRVTVGPQARVGERTVLHPGVVLYARVEIGADCLVHAGAVLGADGFGFDPAPQGWSKVPQAGTVVVEDDVEIGANSTIDRGRFGPTRIKHGTKIDNLVHIAHNVQVGPEALLIAQVGVAGSSRIGRRAILAGQVGITGHVEIGDGARLAAQSGVTKNLEGGKDYFGSPAKEKSEIYRVLAIYHNLPDLVRRVKELERRLEQEGKNP